MERALLLAKRLSSAAPLKRRMTGEGLRSPGSCDLRSTASFRLTTTVAHAGASVASAPMQSEGNSVKALISEIRKEEVKVYINLEARIKARRFPRFL